MEMMLFTADPAVWDPHVGARIRQAVSRDRTVVVRTISGAVVVLQQGMFGGLATTVGFRQSLLDPFTSDGLRVVFGRVEATSCGLWAANGYRSTRPVVVHAVDHLEDLGDGGFVDVLGRLAAGDDPHAWLRVAPAGHPASPCPVGHCPLLRTA